MKPAPPASATQKSMSFSPVGRWSAGASLSRVIARARMTTESASIMNWVKDRSGAPKSMKSSATAKPCMPSETIAVSRSRATMTARRPTTAISMTPSS